MIESEALVYIDSQSIYASDGRKIKFVKRLNDMIEAMNEVDEYLNSTLLSNPLLKQSLFSKFNFNEIGNNHYKIAISPEILKTWLQA